jgi:hypothetical protein
MSLMKNPFSGKYTKIRSALMVATTLLALVPGPRVRVFAKDTDAVIDQQG